MTDPCDPIKPPSLEQRVAALELRAQQQAREIEQLQQNLLGLAKAADDDLKSVQQRLDSLQRAINFQSIGLP